MILLTPCPGNTPGHVLLSEGVSVSAGDSLYTNSMEGVLARPQLDTVRGLNISQVAVLITQCAQLH